MWAIRSSPAVKAGWEKVPHGGGAEREGKGRSEMFCRDGEEAPSLHNGSMSKPMCVNRRTKGTDRGWEGCKLLLGARESEESGRMLC